MANTNSQKREADSLLELIRSTSGEEKAKNLLLLAKSLSNQYYDSSFKVALVALKLADSLKNPALVSKANYFVGNGYYHNNNIEEAERAYSKSMENLNEDGDVKLFVKNLVGMAEIYSHRLQYDSARYMLEHAEELAVKHKYNNALPNIYNNLATISNREGNYLDAIEKYLQAAKLFQELEYWIALAQVYQNIGVVYDKLENFEDAIIYMIKALEINKKENHLTGLQGNYNSLANVYSGTDSLDKSRQYYELALDVARKDHDEFGLARTSLNLANLTRKQENYQEAGKYYDSAMYYSEKNHIVFGIIATKLNLGNYYNSLNEHKKALKVLREDQQMLSQYNIPDMSATLFYFMSNAFKGMGTHDSALYYYEKYAHINDSISGQQTKDKVLELERKYQLEQKAREIAELHNNILEQTSRNRFFLAAFIFVITILISITFLMLARRRATRLKSQLVRQENKELKNTMELRNQELVSKALMVSNLNEQLERINSHVQQISPSLSKEATEKMDILVKDLEITLPDHAWHEFETRFDQVHQGFFTRLLNNYPELSPTELKICSLLRLNMSTKDIALLTNRSIGTVDNIRSSIRKKLNLDADSNLTSFLLNL